MSKSYPSQQTFDTLPSFVFESSVSNSYGHHKVSFLFTDLAYCCGVSVLSNIQISVAPGAERDKVFEEFYEHILKHTTQAQIMLSETPNPYKQTNLFISWLIEHKPKDYLVSNGYVGNALYLGANRGGAIRVYTWIPEQRQFCYKQAPVAYGKLQPLEHQKKKIMEFAGDGAKPGFCRAKLGTTTQTLNFYEDWRSNAFKQYEDFESSQKRA